MSARPDLPPWLYDLVQWLAGAHLLRRRARRELVDLRGPLRVLDAGSGTGMARQLWREPVSIVAVDLEMARLCRFLGSFPADSAVRADVAALPVRASAFDVVTCMDVVHHLEDANLARFLAEVVRALRPGGFLVLIDAVWNPRWLTGRLLWGADRGAHPRRRETLRKALEDRLEIHRWARFRFLHDYVICVATPRAEVPPLPPGCR
jgi:SAM-dependent methyltransferase